jgi:hypothetical protein
MCDKSQPVCSKTARTGSGDKSRYYFLSNRWLPGQRPEIGVIVTSDKRVLVFFAV